MTTEGQPVTERPKYDWHDSQCGEWDGPGLGGEPLHLECDCLVPKLVAATVAEAHAAGLAQGRAKGLDVERLATALLRAVPGYRRWLGDPAPMSGREVAGRVDAMESEARTHAMLIAREYAALAETPVEAGLEGLPGGREAWVGEPDAPTPPTEEPGA